VVDAACQGRGLGRKLMAAVEAAAWQQGIRGILLGTDDETSATSLSQVELGPHNLLDAMQNVRNLKQHPYAFYERCGYTIVGVVPDASGSRKPDIWMWKRLTEPGDPHNASVFP
jgi:aminoglycoside 6'-N-acetyltransferase I